jgi:hypothetical protein
MISIFKQYKPMKKQILHDYHCQIMTQKVSFIYIYTSNSRPWNSYKFKKSNENVSFVKIQK